MQLNAMQRKRLPLVLRSAKYPERQAGSPHRAPLLNIENAITGMQISTSLTEQIQGIYES